MTRHRPTSFRRWATALSVSCPLVLVACGDSSTATGQDVTAPPNSVASTTAPAESTTAPTADLSAFCAELEALDGERPATYVGSAEHVADVERLAQVAPAVVADRIETYRAFLAGGSVDAFDPDSQLTESWPADVQGAISEIVAFADSAC